MVDYIEIMGVIASVIVAISLMMSSLIRLRWFNLIGSLAFVVYGVYINSIPVAGVNGFIVFINIYYLFSIYSTKEQFKINVVKEENEYLNDFIDFHKQEISKFFPNFDMNKAGELKFLIHRNVNVAGLVVARKQEDKLFVELDFAIPQYRDFKIGKFLYNPNLNLYTELGVKQIICEPQTKKHIQYISKMGFEKCENNNQYSLNI